MSAATQKTLKDTCCVSVQALQSIGGTFEGQSQQCGPQMLLFPLFGGCTAAIRRGLTYPKVLCAPKEEERERESGDITWLDRHFRGPARQKS